MGVRAVAETYHEDEQPKVTQLYAELPAFPAASPQRPDPEPARPQAPRPNRDPQIAELMATLARILGFRFQLLLAFIGAVGLGAYALNAGTWKAILVFAIYCGVIFVPTLSVARQRG